MRRRDRRKTSALEAGRYGAWVGGFLRSLRSGRASRVPCGDCTACCAAFQFIHIGPGEKAAKAHIPTGLRFPAPRAPKGHVLMGYDEKGRCPMLRGGRCSIYPHRPVTCRIFDCRAFAATGVKPEKQQRRVAEQAARWNFVFPDGTDRVCRKAVGAAVAFLKRNRTLLPEDARPTTRPRLAVSALKIHRLFMPKPTGRAGRDAGPKLRGKVIRALRGK